MISAEIFLDYLAHFLGAPSTDLCQRIRPTWIHRFRVERGFISSPRSLSCGKKNGVDSFCTDGAIAEQIIAKNTGRELPW